MNLLDIFAILFIHPITNILVAIFRVLDSAGVPYPLGFSIIALTIFIRILLYPLSAAQIRSAHKMQKMAPHMANIREKHREDKKRQQEEMMKLYKEHGINPASGCLPFLIQFPIFISLYNVLMTAVGSNAKVAIDSINKVLYFDFLHINGSWDTSFFGIPLAQTPAQLMGSLPVIAFGIPILSVVSQLVLSKMMVPPTLPQNEKDKKKEKKQDDFQSIMQTQTLYIIPLVVGYASFQFAVGLSLYWITFTLFGILQQYRLAGLGGLASWIEFIQKRVWMKK